MHGLGEGGAEGAEVHRGQEGALKGCGGQARGAYVLKGVQQWDCGFVCRGYWGMTAQQIGQTPRIALVTDLLNQKLLGNCGLLGVCRGTVDRTVGSSGVRKALKFGLHRGSRYFLRLNGWVDVHTVRTKG